MKLKRTFAILMVVFMLICMNLNPTINAKKISDSKNAVKKQSYEDGYNDSLLFVGLTHERYEKMDATMQKIYAEMDLSFVEETSHYYKVMQHRGTDENHYSNQCAQESIEIQEITQQQYFFETTEYLRNVGYFQMLQTLSSSEDDTSTSWLEMTTRLASANTNRWALSNDVSWVQHGTGLYGRNTDVIALGINAQCSIISNSEYLHRHCTLWDPESSIPMIDVDYYPTVQVKSAAGYASYYDVESIEINNDVYFLVALTTNNSNATVIDGYGFYLRRNTVVTPSISFGTGGSSISLSPSTGWSAAPSTHVQLFLD